MSITRSENRLVWALRDMVVQSCDERDGLYDSGFIRCYRTAMEILCEYGHMKKVSEDEHGGRWFQARLVPQEQTPNAFGQDVEVSIGDASPNLNAIMPDLNGREGR